MAAALLIGCSGYMRPSELTGLRVDQIIAPFVHGIQVATHWSIVLHAFEAKIQSKTGVYDENIILDSNYLAGWVESVLTVMLKTRPNRETL
jgi:hypothetical protein